MSGRDSIGVWTRHDVGGRLVFTYLDPRLAAVCRFQVQTAQPGALGPSGGGWELVDFGRGKLYQGFATLTEAMAAADDLLDAEAGR